MAHQISWQGYLLTLAGLTTVYYLVILLVFHRKRLQQFISRRNKHAPTFTGRGQYMAASKGLETENENNAETAEQSPDENFVSRLRDEIIAYALQLPIEQQNHVEIRSGIAQIIRNYPPIQIASTKRLLSQYIIAVCQTYFSVTLSDDEVRSIVEHE